MRWNDDRGQRYISGYRWKERRRKVIRGGWFSFRRIEMLLYDMYQTKSLWTIFHLPHSTVYTSRQVREHAQTIFISSKSLAAITCWAKGTLRLSCSLFSFPITPHSTTSTPAQMKNAHIEFTRGRCSGLKLRWNSHFSISSLGALNVFCFCFFVRQIGFVLIGHSRSSSPICSFFLFVFLSFSANITVILDNDGQIWSNVICESVIVIKAPTCIFLHPQRWTTTKTCCAQQLSWCWSRHTSVCGTNSDRVTQTQTIRHCNFMTTLSKLLSHLTPPNIKINTNTDVSPFSEISPTVGLLSPVISTH